MRVLITGGAGFIGSHLTDKLIARGMQIVILDNLSSGSLANIDHLLEREEVIFIQDDVLNIESCAERIGQVDFIFHLSALVSVQESLADPRKSFQNNAEATQLIFEFARRLQVKGLIFASSAAVYGAQATMPISERCNLSPLSPYAADKAYAEHLGMVYWNAYGLPSLGFRFFNVYGPRQDPKSPYSGVISKFIDACMDGRPLSVYGDGNQTRDFVYVDDLVNALACGVDCLTAHEKKTKNSLINIGSGMSVTVSDLAVLIALECGSTSKDVSFEDGKLGEVRYSTADIARAQAILGWIPSTALRDGVRKTISHYRRERKQT